MNRMTMTLTNHLQGPKYLVVVLAAATASVALAHSGTAVTWNREVSRIFYSHCISCHRPDGESFSLMTFEDAQPQAAQILDAVLTRSMPPWGAVNGFGQFENDMGLSQSQIDVISNWVQGGRRRGNNPNALPALPTPIEPEANDTVADTITVTSESSLLPGPLRLSGLRPRGDSPKISGRIFAILPDGQIHPLVWLYEYRTDFEHPFMFREPLDLPEGSTIQGIPNNVAVELILEGPKP